MRLSTKLILILSAMMLSALLVLSNYAANTSVMGANAFTEARFHNMAVSIYVLYEGLQRVLRLAEGGIPGLGVCFYICLPLRARQEVP